MSSYPARCGRPTHDDGTCCCSYCEGWADGHEVAESEARAVMGPIHEMLDELSREWNSSRSER